MVHFGHDQRQQRLRDYSVTFEDLCRQREADAPMLCCSSGYTRSGRRFYMPHVRRRQLSRV